MLYSKTAKLGQVTLSLYAMLLDLFKNIVNVCQIVQKWCIFGGSGMNVATFLKSPSNITYMSCYLCSFFFIATFAILKVLLI